MSARNRASCRGRRTRRRAGWSPAPDRPAAERAGRAGARAHRPPSPRRAWRSAAGTPSRNKRGSRSTRCRARCARWPQPPRRSDRAARRPARDAAPDPSLDLTPLLDLLQHRAERPVRLEQPQVLREARRRAIEEERLGRRLDGEREPRLGAELAADGLHEKVAAETEAPVDDGPLHDVGELLAEVEGLLLVV